MTGLRVQYVVCCMLIAAVAGCTRPDSEASQAADTTAAMAGAAIEQEPAQPAASVGGSFSATVTGAVSAQLKGPAAFGDVMTADGISRYISLGDPDAEYEIVDFSTENPPKVSRAKIFTYADERGKDGYTASYIHSETLQFGGTDGTLDITKVTAKEVVGTFTFPAQTDSLDGDPPRKRVTVRGSFTALKTSNSLPAN